MKIGERKDFMETATVTLMEGVDVIVNSMPFGFGDIMQRELPSPVAPLKPRKTANGELVYKDKKKGIFATEPDEENKEYKEATSAQVKRQMAFFIYHGTKKDPNLKWDTPEEGLPPEQFYQGIYDELVEANIGSGHIAKLVSAIMLISGVSEEQVEEVGQVFLGGAA